MLSKRTVALLLVAFAHPACSLFSPTALLERMARITFVVRDQVSSPIEGVEVCVVLPNDVGTTYRNCAWTDANGGRTLYPTAMGRRTVTARPPAGFSALPEATVQQVDVVEGRESVAEFWLTRD